MTTFEISSAPCSPSQFVWQQLLHLRELVFEPVDDVRRDRRAIVGIAKESDDLRDAVVEERLVAAVLRQRVEDRARRLRQVDPLEHRMERVLHERLDSRVVGHVEPERDEARRVAAQHVRVARRREPLREPGGRIVPLDQRDDRRRIEKLLVHERGEIVGDLVLVLRNDLRVPRHERNRHAAKQRDHREPVGERAHHRRLRHRLDAVDPEAARREQRRREHARRGEQQRERAPLAVPEFPFLVVEHRDPVVSVSSRFRLVMHAAAPTAETSPSAERPRSRSLRRAHAARRR